MKQLIFIIAGLMIFAMAGYAQADNQDSTNDSSPNQGQDVAADEAADTEEEEEEEEEDSEENDSDSSNEEGESETNDEQEENQNQIKNQGEEQNLTNQETEQEGEENSEKITTDDEGEEIEEEKETAETNSRAVERRSIVANAVQEVLQVTEQTDGIGEQIRVMAQAQNQNHEQAEDGLEKIQQRSGIIQFFLGPNYGEVKRTGELLEENQNRLEEMSQLMSQVTNQSDKQNLIEQIGLLETTNEELSEAVEESSKGFSLFGWLIKIFVE
ncbi:MAG: hypothetical protein WC702_01320 [Patescibacteria group bacterium]|jgi:hypothetical protein